MAYVSERRKQYTTNKSKNTSSKQETKKPEQTGYVSSRRATYSTDPMYKVDRPKVTIPEQPKPTDYAGLHRANQAKPSFESNYVKDYSNLHRKEQKRPTFQSNLVDKLPKTAIDQRVYWGGKDNEKQKASEMNYLGMNLIPAYEEDSTAKRVGKGIVNYGIGGPLSLAANTFRSVVDAPLANLPKNITSVASGKGLAGFNPEYDVHNILDDAGVDGVANTILGTLLSPSTYFAGGLIDDMARAGTIGKGARLGTTENVIMSATRNQKALQSISRKMKSGVKLAADEIETVRNTPELRALPEAEQYLMLEAPKPPNVIEMPPIRPDLDDITTLKTRPGKTPQNASYTDWGPDDLTGLKNQLTGEKKRLLDEQVEWLKQTSGKGVEQGTLHKDLHGNVVGRQGRVSKNELWYQDSAKSNGYRKPLKNEWEQIADRQLREGFETNYGYIPPHEDYSTIDSIIRNFDDEIKSPGRIQKSLDKSKQYLNAKSTPARVPEQFRKETPFTVFKSSEPPKVDPKYAKESFTPIGGRQGASVAEDTGLAAKATISSKRPIGQTVSSGIGEKPLSFPGTIAKGDIVSSELKQMIRDNPLSYKPINNADTLKYAQEIVDKNFEAAKRVVKEGKTFANATESAMAQDIVRRLQNAKQWDEAFEVMEVTAKKLKTSGQTIQAASMWRRMTPEGMLRYADRVIAGSKGKMTKEFADKLTDSMKRIDGITDERQLIEAITKQSGKTPKWVQSSMGKMTPEMLQDIAIAQVLSDIAEQVPKGMASKISTLQAASHLINAKTALRNIFGNIAFGSIEKVSNLVATPFDALGSLFTGKRTLTTPRIKGTFRAGLERARDSAIDASLGIDRTGIKAGKYNVPIGSSFKGKAGKSVEKMLRYELTVPDEFFKGQVYDDVLKQQMKAAGVKNATQDMMDYASHRARYATFQDDSLPAQLLVGFKDLSNKIGAGETVRGKSGLMTREFGLGDFLIKYTTVPGNLIARSLDYTPAGLLKILSISRNANLSAAVKQSEIAMTIGRALTGTGMVSLGVALNRNGLIVSEDKDASYNALSLDREEGLGNYKVNVSAIERMLNGESPRIQVGDELYSYNWLEPVGVALAIGAEVDKAMRKDGEVQEIALNATNAAFEEIMDLQTLTVIRQIMYQDGVFDKAITPIVQGASGFVPGPVRQLSQFTDPVSRATKGETPLETGANRVKQSLPIIREGLEPNIGVFGEEKTYPTSAFNTFVNPGNASIYTPNDVTPALKELEQMTGKSEHYPRSSAPHYFRHEGKDIVLTAEEKTAYMRAEGQEVSKLYKDILKSGVSKNNADGQVSELAKAKRLAHEKGKEAVLKIRGIKTKK